MEYVHASTRPRDVATALDEWEARAKFELAKIQRVRYALAGVAAGIATERATKPLGEAMATTAPSGGQKRRGRPPGTKNRAKGVAEARVAKTRKGGAKGKAAGKGARKGAA